MGLSTPAGPAEEWVIVADRDTGATIVRSGFETAREAALVRRELERRLRDDDTTNYLLLTRAQATQMLREP